MAIPCNGISECLNGMDEECDENNRILVGVVLVLVILTNITYHYLKWYCLNWIQQNVSTSNAQDGWNLKDCVTLIGDELANMKVSHPKRSLQIQVVKFSKINLL